MTKSAKSKAEERFAKIRRLDDQFHKEREATHRKSLEKTARLRALRLAKEASDAEEAAATEGPARGASAGKRKRSA